MNKEEVLKQLFQLSKEDILDIFEIINGYKSSLNKCKKDSLGLRSIYIAGYHSTGEFYKENNITKDHSLAKLITKAQASNIKTFLELKEILHIDDDMFLKIIKEVE